MRKYLNYEGFYDFLESIETDKETILCTEDSEGDIDKYTFKDMTFVGWDIILYESSCGGVGIIQDPPGVITYDDMVEGAWQDITMGGECKVYIEV